MGLNAANGQFCAIAHANTSKITFSSISNDNSIYTVDSVLSSSTEMNILLNARNIGTRNTLSPESTNRAQTFIFSVKYKMIA